MAFKIIKTANNEFWHEWSSGAKRQNVSDFDVVIDSIANTFVIVLRNGANIPQSKLIVTDIIVIDQTDASIEETFTSVVDLKARLKVLGYTPYQVSGGGSSAVDSVNGQIGIVVLDASDITETATRKWVSPTEKSTWNGKENALGFTPENSSNKSNSLLDIESTTKFPVWAILVSYITGLGYQTAANVSSAISSALSGYATQSWVNAQNFLTSVADATTSVKGIMKLFTSTGSNTDGTMTQKAITDELVLKADKQLSAYSMRVNNTNVAANATEVTAKIVNKQTFSTGISFTGPTAPSGTANLSYSWQQIGNMVTLQVNGVYGTAGSGITAIIISLFADLPAPVKPDGLSNASEVLYFGTGLLAASTTTITGVATHASIRSNSANNGFEIVISQAANNTKAFHFSITYPTA